MNWLKKKWEKFLEENFLGKIWFIIKVILLVIFVLLLVLIFIAFFMWMSKTPKNISDWEFGMQKLQNVVIDKTKCIDNCEDILYIKNVRDFDWRKIGNEEKYKDMDFKLGDIVGMEVGVSHFSKEHEGLAHVFTIFKLKDGKDIAVSIETRRDSGEKFEFWKGMFFDYELIYILATKEDLLSLREKRNEKIYIYPIKTTPKKAQKIFMNFVERVNSLYQKPEFYHILFRNCTTLTVREVQKVSDKEFPLYVQTFTPGNAGRVLFEAGLIDTDEKDFEKMREKFLIKFNNK